MVERNSVLENSDGILSPEVEHKTRYNINNCLETIFQGFQPKLDQKLWVDAAIIALAPLTEDEYIQLSNRQNLPQFKTIARIFFEELENKIEEKRDDFSSEQIEGFCDFVREIFFSSSETIFRYLSLSDFLKVISLFTRIPETQGNIGGIMVGEVVYQLSCCGSVESLVDEIISFSPSEIIDILNLFGKILSSAASQGSWSQEGWKKVVEIIQGIEVKVTSHFVQYACKNVLSIAESELDSPTGSIYFTIGDKSNSRLSEKLSANDQVISQNLEKQIFPEGINSFGRLLPVAKGVVANFDHSLRPQEFGEYKSSPKAFSVEVPVFLVDAFIEKIRNIQDFYEYADVLFMAYESIFLKLFGGEALTQWQKTFPMLSKEDWSILFQQEVDIQALQFDFEQKKKVLRKEGKEACAKASNDFMKILQEFLVVHGARFAEIYPNLEGHIVDFKKEWKRERVDKAFSFAIKILVPFCCESTRNEVFQCLGESNSHDLIGGLKKVVDSYNRVISTHEEIWATMGRKVQKELMVIQQNIETIEKKGVPLFRKLADYESDIKSLSKKLEEIKKDLSKNLTKVSFHPYTKIISDGTLNPFPEKNDGDTVLLLQELHNPEMREVILNDLGIDVREMSFPAQIHFLRFLQDKDSNLFDKLQSILQLKPEDQKQNILESFLSCANDRVFGNTLLELAEHEDTKIIFSTYAQIAQTAEKSADALLEWYSEQSPNNTLSWHDFYQGLLVRGKILLEEAHKAVIEGDFTSGKIKQLVLDLKQENEFQMAARSFFDSIGNVLGCGKSINLQDYQALQRFIVEAFESQELKKTLLSALQAQGVLAPVPEIHWRVNREGAEYDRRFGFCVKEFLENFAENGSLQTLVEFGPGNGTFRKERQNEVAGYADFALCDKIYYPVNDLIKNMLDFDKLQQECGELSGDDQKLLSDFLYKILVIQEGQTEEDQFEYDLGVMEKLRANPNTIKKCILQKVSLLKETKKVPDVVSTRDDEGNVIYPYKIDRPQNPSFAKACDALANDFVNFTKEPLETMDVFDHLPAYVPGTIVGDFNQVKNLEDGHIDVALGVRSTVYLRDEEYETFMEDMIKKVSQDGFYIDDNVRDNDGWYYRLAELQRVQERSGQPIWIITGPGFEGEDHNQKDDVPLSVILTKSEEKLDYVKNNLSEGFELKKLDEITNDKNYLKTIDATEKVYHSLYPE